MTPPAVKICGLKSRPALNAALAGKARYVGFNFIEKSLRFIAPSTAPGLRADVLPTTLVVALTADATDRALSEIVATVRPDLLQLHGAEPPARVHQIRELFSIPIIKACPIGAQGDVGAALTYEAVADHILFDAKPPKGSGVTGGHGIAFDWKLLSGRMPSRPWFLSGGLTAENLREAIRVTGAPIVDVSSGVESQRGEKDPALITAFLDTARAL